MLVSLLRQEREGKHRSEEWERHSTGLQCPLSVRRCTFGCTCDVDIIFSFVLSFDPPLSPPCFLNHHPWTILAMLWSTAVPIAAAWQEGASVSRHVSRVCWLGIAMLSAEESLAKAQESLQTTCCRAMRRGAVQGPTGQGGMSHLLPADANEIDSLYIASTRDYIVRANIRLCERK